MLNQWLESLEDERGRLTPEAVVEAAKDPDSPGHAYFDWDDGEAAHKWRISQARSILSVKVVRKDSESSYKAPRYVHDPFVEPAQQMYVAVRYAKTDDQLKREIMLDEIARVEAGIVRAQGLAKYFSVESELNNLSSLAKSLRTRVNEMQTSGQFAHAF